MGAGIVMRVTAASSAATAGPPVVASRRLLMFPIASKVTARLTL